MIKPARRSCLCQAKRTSAQASLYEAASHKGGFSVAARMVWTVSDPSDQTRISPSLLLLLRLAHLLSFTSGDDRRVARRAVDNNPSLRQPMFVHESMKRVGGGLLLR
jgi:hypothetical protein